MRSTTTIVACLSLLCSVFLTSCGKKEDAKSPNKTETARSVQVTKVELRPMERVMHVVGTLAARDEATISAQVAGQLEKNYVDIGDRVKAGQELALIDTASYEALAKASAASLARANASAANAAQNLRRTQDLQREKIASISDLEGAVADASRTKSEVRAAEANEAIAILNLARSRVVAPFDGIIAARLASSGDYLAIGNPIVRLVQTDPLRLRLEVPERDSFAVQVGQRVRVTVECDTNTYHGEIARIAPAIRDENRMLRVEADIPNQRNLRAGLFVRAVIIVNEYDEAVGVPANAIVRFAGLEKVVMVKDGIALEKAITTGRHTDDWVEVTLGLKAGDSVVLDPGGIRTGQAVTVVDQTTNRSMPAVKAVP